MRTMGFTVTTVTTGAAGSAAAQGLVHYGQRVREPAGGSNQARRTRRPRGSTTRRVCMGTLVHCERSSSTGHPPLAPPPPGRQWPGALRAKTESVPRPGRRRRRRRRSRRSWEEEATTDDDAASDGKRVTLLRRVRKSGSPAAAAAPSSATGGFGRLRAIEFGNGASPQRLRPLDAGYGYWYLVQIGKEWIRISVVWDTDIKTWDIKRHISSKNISCSFF